MLINRETKEIDLGKAPSLPWDAVPPSPGDGVYDSNKWAVVFKYSNVTLGAGTKVSFKNNDTRAPVVWLVTGDVTIDGTLGLNGGVAARGSPFEPGPGGFRGGVGSRFARPGSGGFGPGGGFGRTFPAAPSHSTSPSANSSPAYGDPTIIQLIGGSGGGGRDDGDTTDQEVYGGGSGGGAILIIATGKIRISGTLSANGTYGGNTTGSGGSIRLVGDEVGGNGTVSAIGESLGYIRIEANSGFGQLDAYPRPDVASFLPGEPVRIWPPDTHPTARIVSVSGATVPGDPKAGLQYRPTDLRIPAGGSREVIIETTHFPTNGTVTLFATPLAGDRKLINASYVAGDESKASWKAVLNTDRGHTVLQVRAATP